MSSPTIPLNSTRSSDSAAASAGRPNGLEIAVSKTSTTIRGELGERLPAVQLVAVLRRTDTGEMLHETVRIITPGQLRDSGELWHRGITLDVRTEFERCQRMLVERVRGAPTRVVDRLPPVRLSTSPALIRLVLVALSLWAAVATVFALRSALT